jgi:bifunctional DNA-binding transcriptional regulator/antitoxin component of YhaV-PrlF toxin-antitoxin module
MASLTSRVSSKAQTVLPKVVREKLGVKPGDTPASETSRGW